MTYGELKRKVLELMDRATVAGSDISPAYNGQSDVLRRIPGLLNDAVMRIRDRIPLEDQVLLGKTQGEAVGPYRRYALPEDFWLFKTGYVWRVEQDKLLPWKDWQRCGDAILLPPGQFWVRYYKYPALLPADPADDYVWGEKRHVLYIAAYYAAAMLSAGEDSLTYTVLMQEFRERFERLREIWCEGEPVEDVYEEWGWKG